MNGDNLGKDTCVSGVKLINLSSIPCQLVAACIRTLSPRMYIRTLSPRMYIRTLSQRMYPHTQSKPCDVPAAV